MPALTINDLPPEKLPEFWNDNARINALYAPFRERSANSRDWDSKLNFWKSIIDTWTNYNNVCLFSETELKSYFIKSGRVPACLNVVLGELYKNNELQMLSNFLETPQKSWTGWAIDVTIKKPLHWSINKVKSTFVSLYNADTKFVHLPTVRNLSDKLFKAIPDDFRNKLITIDEFLTVTDFKSVDTETINLLLHYLQCQNKIEILQNIDVNSETSDEKVKLIKVAFNGISTVQSISEIDLAKYKLERNEKILLKKIEELESAKTEATNSAKDYVRKGMRQMAKTSLRKQHEIEKRIDSQVNVLENVQTLLCRIGTAESDSKVVDSYKSGLNALKSVFKENDLTEDTVQDTMLNIGEALDIHDDIQTTLSQSMTSILDAELEEELAELLNETPTQPSSPTGGSKEKEVSSEKENLEERLKKLKLPAVPTESPSASSVKSISY